MKKGILLGIGIIGTVLFNGCDSAPEEKAKASAPATQILSFTPVVTPVEWQTYSDNDLHFSFESPITLEVNKPPAGLNAKTMDLQGGDIRQDIYLRVNVQDIGKLELDLNAEFDKQVATLKSMDAALRNLQVATSPVTFSDAAGFLAEGTASLPGKVPYEIKMLLIRKDATLMNMLIQYNPTEEYKAAAGRILNSIAFSN